MLKRLGFHSDDMVLAFVVWLCSLPLVGLVVIPFFGPQVAGVVAVMLLFVVMAVCWGMCTWKVFKGRDNSS